MKILNQDKITNTRESTAKSTQIIFYTTFGKSCRICSLVDSLKLTSILFILNNLINKQLIS